MNIAEQGGGCCGRRIMYGMNGATTASILSMIRNRSLDARSQSNKVIEIVVSEENANLEQLKLEIVGAGFVLVARWNNCTGSECWMYLWAPNWTAFPNGVPVAGPLAPVAGPLAPVVLPAPAPAPAPPAPAPAIVASFFYNVLAAGRSTAGHTTFQEARAAAPRCRRVDRLNVYASGQRRWVEDVRE